MKKKLISSIVLAGMIAFGAQADGFTGSLYIEDATINPGGTATLSVQLNNNIKITGFQFKMELPEGISFSSFALGEERLPSTVKIEDCIKTQSFKNQVLICAASLPAIESEGAEAFTGTSGEVATVTIVADASLAEGTYTITLKEIDVTDSQGKDYDYEDGIEDTSFTLTVGALSYDEGYSVEILPFEFKGNANVSQPIILANKTAITNLKFDVEVPSYFTDNNLSRATTVLDDWDFTTNAEISSNIIHITVDASTGCSIAEGNDNIIVKLGIRNNSGATAGVYPITIKNIQLTDVGGNTYLAAPYTTEIFVGNSPKATATDGVAAFHGNYGGVTEFALLKAALPTGATIDLTEVSAMAEDATTLKTDNVIVTADAVAYGRTVSNEWGTLCLPFAVESDDNIQLYEMSGASSKALSFEKVASAAANTPLVFKATGGFSIKTTNDGTFDVGFAAANPKVSITPSVTNWVVNGSFIEESIDVSSLQAYALSGGQFHRATSKIHVKPFRAWFQNNGAPMGAAIRIEEGTDGIDFVEQEDGSVKLIYDMQGRLLKNGEQQQMYIENGKKVISINK